MAHMSTPPSRTARRIEQRQRAKSNRRLGEQNIAANAGPNKLLQNWWMVAVLIGINFVYLPLLHYEFINYDDPQYVLQNPDVTAGMTWHGIAWAFTTGRESNWHPLTWLSHMIDAQVYGLNSGGHHLTNILFHILNTVLLFAFLLRMTDAPASMFVAALFAVSTGGYRRR